MTRRMPLCSLSILILAAALSLGVAGAASAAERPQEISALTVETLFQEVLGAGDVKPIFAELGGGFYSLEVPLSAEAVARLQEAGMQADPAGARPGRGQRLFVLAAGVQLTAPSNPSTMIHAALANKSLAYNHWVVVVNLGSTVTKKTTIDLAGPKKFNRQVSASYGANAIWAIWYNPGAGVSTSGLYTLKATVDDAGTATTKYYAN